MNEDELNELNNISVSSAGQFVISDKDGNIKIQDSNGNDIYTISGISPVSTISSYSDSFLASRIDNNINSVSSSSSKYPYITTTTTTASGLSNYSGNIIDYGDIVNTKLEDISKYLYNYKNRPENSEVLLNYEETIKEKFELELESDLRKEDLVGYTIIGHFKNPGYIETPFGWGFSTIEDSAWLRKFNIFLECTSESPNIVFVYAQSGRPSGLTEQLLETALELVRLKRNEDN